MTKYRDIETGDILTKEDLKKEYIELFETGNTESETIEQYISNCMYYNNGTLVIVGSREDIILTDMENDF